ncbi:uncharacterized protein VTP21DRAFT_2552 [Calcarisporiella thermophila]|uniref:uncharacterized protein n=1 Tax=Calcarisporiella thermophila TaxID=911321 RepID=UPI0037432F4B
MVACILTLQLAIAQNLDSQLPVCNSARCYEVAEKIKSAMNLDVNPCENFYQYSCGNFIGPPDEDYYIPDLNIGLLSGTKTKSKEYFKNLLNGNLTNPSERWPLVQLGEEDYLIHEKLKKLYNTCTTDFRDKYFKVMTKDSVSQAFQRLAPYLHFVTESLSSEPTSLGMLLARLNTLGRGGISSPNPLFRISGSTISGTDRFLIFRRFEFDSCDRVDQFCIEEIKRELEFATNISMPIIQRKTLDELAQEVAKFSVELGKGFRETMEDLGSTQEMTIAELSRNIPVIDWETYFRTLFPPSVSVPEKVFVESPGMVRKLTELLSTSFEGFKSYLNYNLIKYFKMNVLYYASTGNFDRCIDFAIDAMPLAAARFLVLSEFSQADKDAIETNLARIQQSFTLKLAKMNWLNSTKIQIAVNRLHSLKKSVIISDHNPNLLSGKEVAAMYSDFNPTDDHYDNIFIAAKHHLYLRLSLIDKPVDLTSWKGLPRFFDESIISVDYHLSEPSVLRIYSDITELYDHALPSYVNFARLYWDIAKNIIDSYDTPDISWDISKGCRGQCSENSYTQRSKCFADKYAEYLKSHHKEKLSQFSHIWSPDSLPNKWAVSLSYNIWQQNKGQGYNAKLPGLESYTPEQMFFINMANKLCHKAYPWDEGFNSQEEKIVLGIVQDNEEFVQAFKCPNYKDQCEVW